MTKVKRLYVLLCGFEILPQTVSLRDIGARFIISVPISAYLLDTDDGWVLFDTGLDEANLRDRDKLDAMFLEPGWDPQPVVKPHHELERQLNEIGIGFDDIGTVILSHLHADHTGHIKHMPKARYIVAQREWDYVRSGEAPSFFFASDYDLPGLDWTFVSGDAEIMEGLAILATPGHSPGHQSLMIELPNTGKVLLAADVGDMMRNFEEEILPGGSTNDVEALASIRRINALVAETGARLILTHDPVQIQQLKLAPEYYD
jgi:N-acyl homoserine lactone hydrolase